MRRCFGIGPEQAAGVVDLVSATGLQDVCGDWGHLFLAKVLLAEYASE